MTERITLRQFHEAAGVEDWRVLSEGACTYFRTGSFAAGARLVLADPSAVQTVQVTIDALVGAEVMPFWRAVLGYEYRGDSPDEDLVDPHGRGASFWFQQMDAPRPQRNRIHIDVWVPHDQAEARIAAAIAAGGHLVTDQHAPSWWVLADAEGNEAVRGHLDEPRLSESSLQRSALKTLPAHPRCARVEGQPDGAKLACFPGTPITLTFCWLL